MTERHAQSFPRARKRFGQHFLEPAWVSRLVNAVDPHPDDAFLEIGPGRGALTKVLAPRVREVIAVEIDRDLAAALPAHVPENVRVVEGDFLEIDLDAVLGPPEGGHHDSPPSTSARGAPADKKGGRHDGPVRVIGNLPYNVSSPILFKLLDAADDGRRFSDATLMLQKEVADRLVAQPGTGEYGTLAIQVSLAADVKRLLTLPPGAFRPPPKVTSAVIQLRFRPAAADVGDRDVFEKVVRGIFLQRRKTLANALSPVAHALDRDAADVIDRAAVDGRKRPEQLALEEIARICRAML
jgi:16S rRNA (adenine1518-N6/adenine1519-N6)-dimethyltransferase